LAVLVRSTITFAFPVGGGETGELMAEPQPATKIVEAEKSKAVTKSNVLERSGVRRDAELVSRRRSVQIDSTEENENTQTMMPPTGFDRRAHSTRSAMRRLQKR
jgi:hypothetical protein